MSNIKKLNLTLSYPVKWSIGHVMSDFIQNFYDSLGFERFFEEFQFSYHDSTIEMRALSEFSKDWLFYIGTSTKRGSEENFAGRFGEGFKIAALIAYRDYNLSIRMESKDWTIDVTDVWGTIDGEDVKFLAYDIVTREYSDESVLKLTGCKDDFFNEFKKAIQDFYYKGNPFLGKCIVESNKFAVYHANKKMKGAIFINLQLRQHIDLPLVFCNHNYSLSEDDRDRLTISSYDALHSIQHIIKNIGANENLEILETLKPYWNGKEVSKRNMHIPEIISDLVCMLAENADARKYMFAIYGDKVIPNYNPNLPNNKKKLAEMWYRRSDYYKKIPIVMHEFSKFAIPDLEEIVYKNNGFNVYTEPNDVERQYINILEKATIEIFSTLLCYEKLPKCKIISNLEAPVKGCAYHGASEATKNTFISKKKWVVNIIYLRKDLFSPLNFAKALSVYMHELLHEYGGDRSMSFRKALIMLNKTILQNNESLKKYEEEWRKISCA